MAVKTYRKTALVTAEQFLPAIGQIPKGVYSDGHGDPRKRPDCEWVLDTKEGRHDVRGGDYICTGPAGEQWNVAKEIFEATYEEVTESSQQPSDAAPESAEVEGVLAPAPQSVVSVGALCSSPLIEILTPTDGDWLRCETIQDRYDMMKRLIRSALSAQVQDVAANEAVEPHLQVIKELSMTAFAEALPQRDEMNGEQTILTYNSKVGVWDVMRFESGEEFPDGWFGETHWIDITRMWPGVIAQVATFFNLPAPSAKQDAPESTEEPFPQPSRRDGGAPCGECHIQPGETCDICGARMADAVRPVPQFLHFLEIAFDAGLYEAKREIREVLGIKEPRS